MLNEVSEFIHRLNSDPKLKSYSEDHVKQGVILPLLKLLGWDPFNIDEVTPEYSTKKGRVDYSLRIKRANRFFIEVKKPTEDLEKHQEQLLRYSFDEGVELAALTNGVTWWFYLPKEKGDWQERKFYTVDINEQDPAHIADKLVNILAMDKVEGGQAFKYAEEIYGGRRKQRQIEETMPEAWNKLISDPDTLLVDLLVETTERLCGFKPGNRIVTEFLSSHREKFILAGSESPGVERAKPTVSRRGGSRLSRERIGRRNLGRKGYTQIQDYIIPVIKMMRQGISHTEAFQRQAKALGIAYQTVQNQCSRVLGIKTQEFAVRVSDGTIVNLLKKRYPHQAEMIAKELGER